MSDRSRAWEFQLERWHAIYAMRGHAWVARCHPPAKLIRGRLVYSAKGAPDFGGIIAGRPGRAVWLEAKTVKGARLPFENIASHQAHAFDLVTSMGGIALVVTKFEGWEGWFPWDLIASDYRSWARGDSRVASVSYERARPLTNDGWLTREFCDYYGLRVPEGM